MSNLKRPGFFGKLMPKQPTDKILVDNYHQVNETYDRYPDKHNSVIDVKEDKVICSDGEELKLSGDSRNWKK